MSETANPCQQIICTNTEDVDVYSLQNPPPLEAVTPAGPRVGNAALSYCCDAGYTIDYYGLLPSWLSLNRTTNCLDVQAGYFRRDTQEQADAEAQDALDAFVTTATAAGTLVCVSGCPTRLSVITGFTGTSPYQSAYDDEHHVVWTSWGWSGGLSVLSRVLVADSSIVEISPTGTLIGIQYIPDTPGLLYPEGRLWYNREQNVGTILPIAPYTQTDIISITNGTDSPKPRTLLWIPSKNTLVAGCGSFVIVGNRDRVAKIQLVAGTSNEHTYALADYRLFSFAFNPFFNEVFTTTEGGGAGSNDVIGLDLVGLGETPIDFGAAPLTQSTRCCAYCPENGQIYVPYAVAGVAGIAIIDGTDHSIITQTLSDTATIYSIVYHPARQYMYCFATNKLFVLDINRYEDGADMIVCSSPIATNGGGVTTATIQNNPAVYCSSNRRVYLPIIDGTGKMLVFS